MCQVRKERWAVNEAAGPSGGTFSVTVSVAVTIKAAFGMANLKASLDRESSAAGAALDNKQLNKHETKKKVSIAFDCMMHLNAFDLLAICCYS